VDLTWCSVRCVSIASSLRWSLSNISALWAISKTVCPSSDKKSNFGRPPIGILGAGPFLGLDKTQDNTNTDNNNNNKTDNNNDNNNTNNDYNNKTNNNNNYGSIDDDNYNNNKTNNNNTLKTTTQ